VSSAQGQRMRLYCHSDVSCHITGSNTAHDNVAFLQLINQNVRGFAIAQLPFAHRGGLCSL